MKLLAAPIGLLINFHELSLKDGIHRMMCREALKATYKTGEQHPCPKENILRKAHPRLCFLRLLLFKLFFATSLEVCPVVRTAGRH